MWTSLVMIAVLGTVPAESFVKGHPASERVEASDGRTLVHASGFLSSTGARQPVDAAREFLDTQGAAFGIAALHELEALASPPPGGAVAIPFRRLVSGLPVFGGDVVVGVDGENRVFLVNTTEVATFATGAHAIGDAPAASIARLSLGRTVVGTGPTTVARGYRQVGGELRAVYQVDLVAREPAGDWRVYVDGETGYALLRQDLRRQATAPAKAYEVSPVESASARCPATGVGGLEFCATPVVVTLPNLASGSDLAGSQVTTYDCKGNDPPASASSIPGACSIVSAVSGAFSFAPDTTWISPTDAFAAPNAYYHFDRFATFVKSLDPALPPVGKKALRASIPVFVNAFENGSPLNNAYYSGLVDDVVLGQEDTNDNAYDATVIYHEFTHGIISAWGDFKDGFDTMGPLVEPGALHEGTADAMNSAMTGRSEFNSFTASTRAPPRTYLRDAYDPTASRSCQGDGTLVTSLSFSGVVNGMDGEVHDDGEIWSGLFWEVFQGLKSANVKGCSGACEAAPAIQYKTIQLAGGTSPTFDTYWKTFKAAAAALFPARPAVANYVDCVARRRGFERCNRTLPLYSGERKSQDVSTGLSPFQLTVNVTTPGAQVQVCSASGVTATLYASSGSAVTVNPATGAVTATKSGPVTQACRGGFATLTLDTAGTWYLLLVAGTPTAPLSATFLVQVGATGFAARPAPTPPPSCSFALDPIVVTPANPTVATGSTTTFTATGGSGTGYVWTLAANPSGGTIVASTGLYTAGSAGGVTDVVRVTDSTSGTATTSVAVSAPQVSGGGKGCSTTGGVDAGTLVAVSAFLLIRRRRKLGDPPVDGRA